MSRGRDLFNRRGQTVILAIVALALVVTVLFLALRAPRRIEQEIKDDTRQAVEVRDESVRLHEILEGVVRESLAQAVDEVAQSGGFAPSAVPEPSLDGIPVFVLGGRAVNLPADDVVRAMVREAVARRLEANIQELATAGVEGIDGLELDGDRISLGTSDVEVGDAFVRLSAEIPLTITRDGTSSSIKEPVAVELPLRLLRLVRIARAVTQLYTEAGPESGEVDNLWYRGIESLAAFLMERDPRVPGPTADLTCDPFTLPDARGRRHPGFCMTDEGNVALDEQALRRAIGEDLGVAATLFAARMRSERLFSRLGAELAGVDEDAADPVALMRSLSWSARPRLGDKGEGAASAYPLLNLSVNGGERTITVRGVARDERPCAVDLCSGRAPWYKSYRAVYDIQFPLEVELTDLTPAGRLPSGSLMRPLRLRFVIVPWLVTGGGTILPKAANGPPREVDLACTGTCEATIRPVGAERVQVIVEPCGGALTFDVSGETLLSGLPCGIRRLTVIPLDTEGVGGTSVNVVLPAQVPIDVVLPQYASLTGIVAENTTILCAETFTLGCLDHRTENVAEGPCSDIADMRPLVFVPGSPPAAVRLMLLPVDPDLEMLEVRTDADGRYAFPRVLPGRYILLATPTDQDGTPVYKVRTAATVLTIEGDSEHDVVMDPLFTTKTDHGFVQVAGVRGCAA